MSKSRKEQIINEAIGRYDDSTGQGQHDIEKFIEGAEWADETRKSLNKPNYKEYKDLGVAHSNFEAGEKVLIPIYQDNMNRNMWKLGIYSHYDAYYGHYVIGEDNTYSNSDILPYKGNEDKLGKEI